MLSEASDYKPLVHPESEGNKAEHLPPGMTGQSLEKHSGLNPQDSASSPAEQLSNYVFSNPQEFLQALKTDINHTNLHGGDLTASDLLDTANLMADPKLKAAAVIAAQHFGDLEKMTQNYDLFGDHPLQGSFVDTLSNAYKGDLSKQIQRYEFGQGVMGATAVVASAAMGAVAVITAVDTAGLGAYFSGSAAVGFASVAADSVYNMIRVPGMLRADAQKDEQQVFSWSKFNSQ